MRTKALVAVRAGSQRVKNKNIRPFADSSLLEVKLNQLLRISGLDGVVVNSDDDKMLEIAGKMGCETIKRDAYYASNEVSMSEVYKYMAEKMDTDIIAYINVTNPLIKDETLIQALTEFEKKYRKGECDSLNSAHLIKEFMFRDGKPLNYDLKNQPRSQDLPDIAALNFAVNILPKQTMIECKNVVGTRPHLFLIDEVEATDIDNMIDFEFAEYLYKKGI